MIGKFEGPENLLELHDYSNYGSSDYMSSTVYIKIKEVKGMSKIEFKTLLEFATKKLFFFFLMATRSMESLWVHP